MTDTCMNDDRDSDNENCDQQEIESYLYSLVHHGSLENESQQGPGEETLSIDDNDSTPAAQKTWRYFNATSVRDRGENFKRFQQSNKQYFRLIDPKSQKSFIWRRPLQSVIQSKIAAMEANKNKTNRSAPDVTCMGSNSANHSNISEVIYIDDESKNIHEKYHTLQSKQSSCPAITIGSSSTEDTVLKDSNQVNSSCSPTEENLERNDNSSQVSSQNIDEVKDDLNNTNPSLSSYDDCFEPPSRPKSKSALNESMTQALQVMLDDDASRSSIESSDKRPAPKSKVSVASKPSSGSGWTVGMSWEDMSSKFRFNFEVDSVCGDSVREGSISASSRANTPEAVVPACPEDVSKYDVALKSKTSTVAEVDMDIDNSDSEAESVIEVVKPPKEPPPIFVLSSDNEDDIPSKIKKVDNTPQEMDLSPPEKEEDIVILFETVTPDENTNSSGNGISAVVVNPLATKTTSSAGPSKKRERNRKKAKLAKARGAPDDDLRGILASMSDKPSLWRLCREDIYPRPATRTFRPCENCKQRDHLTWHCPEPVKIKVCSLCAGPGHSPFCCPNRMCLNCGRPAPTFVRGCRLCTRQTVCNICLWTGHQSQQCPDLWRRYHLTTSQGPPVKPPPGDAVRSPAEMWCCNCARKGHISDMCPLASSTINEKRLSHVVSYVDPTELGGDTNRVPAAPRTVASSSKQRLQFNASVFIPQEQNSIENSLVLMAKFTNTPQFKKNYKRFKQKLRSMEALPAKPLALANFLEDQLELLKNPVLSDRQVRLYYIKLMELMKNEDTSKKKIRKATLFASQLNMTVLGFGRLGPGNSLISNLRREIELLRQSKKSKVPVGERIRINEYFAQLFKGTIRSDIDLSVNEYLKRRQAGSM